LVGWVTHSCVWWRWMSLSDVWSINTHHQWMNEWKCEDFKCVWKPTESRLCLTHYVNKSSRWAKVITAHTLRAQLSCCSSSTWPSSSCIKYKFLSLTSEGLKIHPIYASTQLISVQPSCKTHPSVVILNSRLLLLTCIVLSLESPPRLTLSTSSSTTLLLMHLISHTSGHSFTPSLQLASFTNFTELSQHSLTVSLTT